MRINPLSRVIHAPIEPSIIPLQQAVRALRCDDSMRPEAEEALQSASTTIETAMGRQARKTRIDFTFPCQRVSDGNPLFCMPGGPYNIAGIALEPQIEETYMMDASLLIDGAVDSPLFTVLELKLSEDATFRAAYEAAERLVVCTEAGWALSEIPKPIITATRLAASAYFDRGSSRSENQIDQLLTRYKLVSATSALV